MGPKMHKGTYFSINSEEEIILKEFQGGETFSKTLSQVEIYAKALELETEKIIKDGTEEETLDRLIRIKTECEKNYQNLQKIKNLLERQERNIGDLLNHVSEEIRKLQKNSSSATQKSDRILYLISSILSDLWRFHNINTDIIHDIRFKGDHSQSKEMIRQAKERIEVEVDVLKAFYETTQNPLYALAGLKFCLDGEMEIPAWINNYIQGAVCGLFDEIQNMSEERDRTGKALKKCFEFDRHQGRGSFFSAFQTQWNRNESLKKCTKSAIKLTVNPGKTLSGRFPKFLRYLNLPYRNGDQRLKRLEKILTDNF